MTLNIPTLDVRVIPVEERNATLLDSFDALGTGESLQLLHDRNPRLLRRRLVEEYGRVEWTYLEAAPGRWRVKVRKLASVAARRESCRSSGARCD